MLLFLEGQNIFNHMSIPAGHTGRVLVVKNSRFLLSNFLLLNIQSTLNKKWPINIFDHHTYGFRGECE